tara:strand:- start:174 stop:347 length:174 start_codon:yes stop_codon:yes gene_type:complete
MKKFFFIVLIFLSECSSTNTKDIVDNDFTFSNNLTFEEIKLRLIKYSKENSYPDIDG